MYPSFCSGGDSISFALFTTIIYHHYPHRPRVTSEFVESMTHNKFCASSVLPYIMRPYNVSGENNLDEHPTHRGLFRPNWMDDPVWRIQKVGNDKNKKLKSVLLLMLVTTLISPVLFENLLRVRAVYRLIVMNVDVYPGWCENLVWEVEMKLSYNT
ncbi:hypothetical protein F4806DRAFT_451100 [Annulohypoxylon nitens]|nr:hypothetical protein F4806DRAFT_451100 [Annulohypoxylon nitens]